MSAPSTGGGIRPDGLVYCHHGILAAKRLSGSAANPGREYYGCPKRFTATDRCKYFAWVDQIKLPAKEEHSSPQLASPPNSQPESSRAMPANNNTSPLKRSRADMEDPPSTPSAKRHQADPTSARSRGQLTPAERAKRLALIQAACGNGPSQGGEANGQDIQAPTTQSHLAEQGPLMSSSRLPSLTSALEHARHEPNSQPDPSGSVTIYGGREPAEQAGPTDEDFDDVSASQLGHASQDSERSVSRYLSSGSRISSRVTGTSHGKAPDAVSEQLFPEQRAEASGPGNHTPSSSRARDPHAHDGNLLDEQSILLTPPSTSHPEHARRVGRAPVTGDDDVEHTPSKSKGKEREMPAARQNRMLVSDPENPFQDDTLVRVHSHARAQTPSVAEATELHLECLSTVPGYIRTLERKNLAAQKELQEKSRTISELQEQVHELQAKLRRLGYSNQ